MQHFLAIEASSGILLVLATVVALAWANSPWRHSYADVWARSIGPVIGPIDLHLDLLHWVNDGLMATFFFVVGLEIKREWVSGELRDRRAAVLPAFAALGGMVVPALLFVALTAGTIAAHGWGIPMATDIAFAVGVVTLLGDRVPPTLKLFLLTLAIVDDVGAIAVIALVYSGPLAWGWLASAAAVIGLALVLRATRVTNTAVFLSIGVVLWVCAHQSGVHPTIAGVVMALLLPADNGRWEERLHPWTSNAVVPLFALANAGIALSSPTGSAGGGRVLLGVVVGLVIGKTVGVSTFAWLAVRMGWGRLPVGVRWAQVVGVAAVAGIGFTVSLFVTGLAFDEGAVVRQAKLGTLLASLIAATLGAALLVRASGGPAAPEAVDQ